MFGLRIFVAVTLAVTSSFLYGCSEQIQPPEEPPIPVVVYDDGVYLVEAAQPVTALNENGKYRTDITLFITNRSLENMTISSVLGVKAAVPQTDCEIIAAEDYAPIDGLIECGERKEGGMSIVSSAEPESIKIELAVDYLNDQWISFDIVPASE